MFQRTLELEYDKLVIGADLSALSYSYINKIPLIYKSLSKPYKFNIKNDWEQQTNLWNSLAFILSQANYFPINTRIDKIIIENKNLLKIITKNSLVLNIKFNNLIISDDSDIEGLPEIKSKTNNNNYVIDYFNIPCGCEHNLEEITSDDDFVRKIYFYISDRHLMIQKKDAVATSIIEDKNINFFSYSQAVARIKVLKLMKNAGIKGRMNGFYKGRQVHRPILVETDKRLIFPLGKNIYKNLPTNISILYDDYKKILNNTESIFDERISKIKNLYGINI